MLWVVFALGVIQAATNGYSLVFSDEQNRGKHAVVLLILGLVGGGLAAYLTYRVQIDSTNHEIAAKTEADKKEEGWKTQIRDLTAKCGQDKTFNPKAYLQGKAMEYVRTLRMFLDERNAGLPKNIPEPGETGAEATLRHQQRGEDTYVYLKETLKLYKQNYMNQCVGLSYQFTLYNIQVGKYGDNNFCETVPEAGMLKSIPDSFEHAAKQLGTESQTAKKLPRK